MSETFVRRRELSILQEAFSSLFERMLSDCVSCKGDFGVVEESIRLLIEQARPLLVSSGLRTAILCGRHDWTCPDCCEPLTGWGQRKRRIVTSQGDATVSVPRYRCRLCDRDFNPVLEGNGLVDSQFTFGAKERIVEEAAQSAFAQASRDLPATGIHVSAKEVDRIVTEVAAWHFEEQSADTKAAFTDGTVKRNCLYDWQGWDNQVWAQISVDAAKVRSPVRGDDGKLKWFDARGGLIKPIDEKTKGLTFHSAGVMESWDELFETLYGVWRQRPASVKFLVFIADGGAGIWERARLYFKEAVQILDIYHAGEHVGSGAEAIWGSGHVKSAELKKQALHFLKRENGPRQIIRLFVKALRTGKVFDEAELRKQIAYLYGHRHRMLYAKWLRIGLPIGSGAMESAIKQVCVARLRRPGMKWTRTGADNMLRLRTACLSDTLGKVFDRRRQNAKRSMENTYARTKYRLAA